MAYPSVIAEAATNNLDALTAPGAPRTRDGRFRNPARMHKMGMLKGLSIMLRMLFDKPADTVPRAAIPVHAITQQQLLAAPDRTLYRLGHSTVLLKLDGAFWLTDPVFSERASPLQWAGPKRFHQPPISLQDLPPIKGIILSHDHYDHLDYAAVMALAPKTEVFITPLGVGDRLIGWGIPAHKVRQLGWWQSTQVDGIRLLATPTQHFSGRSLNDRNKTLWASFVIEDREARIFFSGDSGYFDGFKEIGRRYGPFDLTMVETGAYDPQWPDIHMQPEESLQAHIDLRGKVMLPIHNGTFDLSLHPWHDPFSRITELAAERRLPLATPEIGRPLSIMTPLAPSTPSTASAPLVQQQWWVPLVAQEAAARDAAA